MLWSGRSALLYITAYGLPLWLMAAMTPMANRYVIWITPLVVILPDWLHLGRLVNGPGPKPVGWLLQRHRC